ncbi:MAG: MerR family transcriptional regulator [Verrucomicrobiota bacterium]
MEPSFFSIGEFSKITGLSVKTLRFYHEKGLLVPTVVDTESGYRYYDHKKIEKARVITQLRALEFSLEDIAAMLRRCEDESDILGFLERHKEQIEQGIRHQRNIAANIERIIATEREAQRVMAAAGYAVEEKTLEPMIVAGVRMRGKYSDCGKGFSQIGRKLGRHLAGPALCLYYDCEYQEDDADFEPCMALRQAVEAEGISVRTLPGGRCVTLVHQGPYEQLGRSYAKILEHVKRKQIPITLPSREVYLKGPGMIFKGDPKKYLTEIQLPVG